MSNVTKLYSSTAAENPDNVLEQAVGEYEQVLIAGFDNDGFLDIRASTNTTKERLLWLIEKAKIDILMIVDKEQ